MTSNTRPTGTAAAPHQSATNVNTAAGHTGVASIWTVSRVIALVFTVLEVLLLVRFTLKLFGANQEQPLASAIYAMTEPLVAPFRGVFAQPAGTPVIEIAALLSIVFFVLLAALIVAVFRAFASKRGES